MSNSPHPVCEWAGDYIEKYYEEDFHDNYRTPTD